MTEPAPFKRPVSILVAIVTHTGHSLVLHRRAPSRFWQSITGSLEHGESPIAAAIREVREETGLHIDADELHDWRLQNRFPIPEKWAARYAPGTRINTEHVFSLILPDVCDVTINAQEHDDAQWLPIEMAIERVWSWTNRDALRLLATNVDTSGNKAD